MNKKIGSYLGFAARARKLCSGYNTCIYQMAKLRLLIITEGISENSKKKLISLAEKNNVKYRIYGNAEELSRFTGNPGKGIFGILDPGLAKAVMMEIDMEQGTDRRCFNDSKNQ